MARKRKGLSKLQKRVLDFIEKFIAENRYSPTLREIGAAVVSVPATPRSTSVVNYNLDRLQEKRRLTRKRGIARSIRLLDESGGEMTPAAVAARRNLLRVPVWGVIKAGMPIPVPDTEAPLDYIALARELAPRGEDIFALRVSGDSMIDALVNDGDVVIMNKPTEVRDGDMVAVWLKDEEETTLKYFYREGKQVRLQPANPTMSPIYTPAKNVEIQGRVMMVVRTIGT